MIGLVVKWCFLLFCVVLLLLVHPVLQSKLGIGYLLFGQWDFFFELFPVGFMSGNDHFWCWSILCGKAWSGTINWGWKLCVSSVNLRRAWEAQKWKGTGWSFSASSCRGLCGDRLCQGTQWQFLRIHTCGNVPFLHCCCDSSCPQSVCSPARNLSSWLSLRFQFVACSSSKMAVNSLDAVQRWCSRGPNSI